ncbi:hypothetical protein F5Y10DRAFT_92829 [Nemania abortiva]|nr:hypothetical protein F5Y10DRAFT_92829 [Nemania abortiva]
MTGNPELWATAADLDPISPSPVHPPSPITVPTLQDQADVYSDMSLAGSNSIALAAASTAGAPNNRDEQTGVPAPPAPTTTSATSVTIQDNTPNGLPGTEPDHVGGTGLEKAANGEAQRTETASAGMSAENMQGPETSRPDTTEAEQDVPELNEFTSNSDTPTLVRRPADPAAPTHENNRPISQILPDSSSQLLPQPPHKLLDDGQIIPNAIVPNIDSAHVSRVLSGQPLANGNYSSTTNHANNPAASIQAVVDNIIAHASDANADAPHIPVPEGTAYFNALPQHTILPPKPPAPEPTFTQPRPPTYETLPCIPGASQPSIVPLPSSNGSSLAAYPGAVQDASVGAVLGTIDPYAIASAMPGTIPMSDYAVSIAESDSKTESLPNDQQPLSSDRKRQWDTFIQEERKYVSEAKWDRFPEGSRIFIGNLSSEHTSKRQMFNIFSKFGRLAQISLKQAYGFVQYHTVAEGKAAMDNLQGTDIGGKKINLEFSRTQRKDGEGGRGNRTRRDSGRQDSNKGRRDDYRPSRQHSPRRSNHRQLPSYDSSHRGRSYQESGYPSDRRRSQSPGYDYHDSYRRRSLSPYRRHVSGADLDLPRRYGQAVPDVQFLLLQEVRRDYVTWAQDAFVRQGLRVDDMFLSPQLPRDAIIQRQVLDGVQAVVELDIRTEKLGIIPLQVFDRSGGYDNVRFDQYQDLDPNVAAQLVAQAKSRAQITTAPYRSVHYPPAQHYPPPAQGHYMPPSYPGQHYPPLAAQGAGGAPLDSDTVHKILGSLNGQQSRPPVDVNSLLTTLEAAPHDMGRPPTQHGMNYGHPLPNLPQGVPYGNNSARHIQDIMSQLSRYRQ